MTRYDPEIPPNATAWLALDEQVRIDTVRAYHRQARIKPPTLHAHAVFHVIIENQIAQRLEPVIRALARLTSDGLSRHDALHAMGCVLREHLVELSKADIQDTPEAANSRYFAAVERSTAKLRRQEYGDEDES